MKFNNIQYRYPSKRNVVYAKNGMVATSQPLAANAGIEVMKKGGNAIDAAVATAAALTVVEPTANGIGSDSFALVWTKNDLFGLNGSGYAPEQISINKLTNRGFREMPVTGMVPVTVPGTPSAWAKLIERFGNLSLEEVLEPAIRYAREGYVVSENLAAGWKRAFEFYSKFKTQPAFKEWFKVFAPEGRAPLPGEIFYSQAHAETLTEIAKTKATSFYKGKLANDIDYFSRMHSGFLRKKDLMEYEAEWVKPININYKGYDIWEIPPNGQGIVALQALSIMKNFEELEMDNPDTIHKQIESIKLAFADGFKYVTDKKSMKVSVEEMLDETYIKERANLIKEEASIFEAGVPADSGTVYLATADREGNMVSYIQSNYMGFGSGIVVEGTGIALNNRGHNFSMDEAHDNRLMPRKKPYHTIIPGFITKGTEAVGPFGVMGGFMQPQGHLQVIMNLLNFNMNPQEALDAPRFRFDKDKKVHLEPSFNESIVKDLIRRGHEIIIDEVESGYGRGQIIIKQGMSLIGGTEKRTDGYIAIF